MASTASNGLVWLPQGGRLETVFTARDARIAELSGFVCDVANRIRSGASLASAVRGGADHHPSAVAAFELAGRTDASIETQFALCDALTFPNEHLPAALTVGGAGGNVRFVLDALTTLDARTMLSMCGSARFSAHQIREALDEPVRTLFDALLEHNMLATGRLPSATRAFATGPGVTRLQHAGLLYRGRTAGVLVDPHLHSSYEPHGMRESFLRHELEGLVDAILISHSHLDHFHLPTLMSFPREIPIVVPHAPRASMLCPDFSQTLRALGFQHVIVLQWYDPPFSVGDLEVHALPFYGEQPLAHEAPRHPDLRNHGNTYVVCHDTYTSWLLIDSGDDRLGRMSDVAREVAGRFGGVDLLISNLREFTPYTPLYITGAGHYWLSLTPEQMKRFDSMRGDLLTLGPAGVAEVCRIARAREFLPYAHWWGEPGEAPGQEEHALLEQLQRDLIACGAETTILPWRIGDTHLADRGTAPRTQSNALSDVVPEHQRRLLEQIRQALPEVVISEATSRAFLSTPRHRFVQRYRVLGSTQWNAVDEHNLRLHLGLLYADRPLCLAGDDDASPVSTISQPSVVLRMLEMLRLQPGHVVFELGTGSGWNAALMAHLVGSAGRVFTTEVIPMLAEAAARNLSTLGVSNASVIATDGGEGYPPGAPFDRAIWTAGSYDLPGHFYTQVREGGLLLMVLKIEGGGDRLHLLQHKGDHFESIESVACDFVSLQGRYHLEALDSLPIEALPGWKNLEHREIAHVPHRWDGDRAASFLRRTEGIRTYLSIAEPMFRTFRRASTAQGGGTDRCFGLWDENPASLVLAQDDQLISYGARAATDRLWQRIHEWTALGMPDAATYRLATYPVDHRLNAGPNQRIVRRAESQFLWTLPAPPPPTARCA